MRNRFRRTSGSPAGNSRTVGARVPPIERTGGRTSSRVPGMRGSIAGLVAAALTAGGCNYSFISGAGLPSHIRTVAVLPFENDTGRFELTQEIHEALLRQLPRALGLNQAGEQTADAVISGTIVGYSLTAPLYRRGREAETVQVLQREVVLQVKVQILDREEYTILWDNNNLRVVGQYLDASESEEVGRAEAIELLVQKIVDGAQSNW